MLDKNHQFDVIITGAGPAGATCALTLHGKGLKVALVDKSVFPRDKICGDAVSSVVRRVLNQINPDLAEQLMAFEPKASITQATVYSPSFHTLTVRFSKVGYCIPRLKFDNWLYEHAVNHPDITAISGVGVKSVATDETGVSITLDNGETITGKVLVGCDGAHSIAAKQLANFKVDRKHYSGAVRQYYKNVANLDGQTLEIYLLEDYLPGYFWIFPLANQEANVGFGMLSETIANQKIDLKKSIQDIINKIPEVKERFKHAEAIDGIKGFGLPLGSKRYPISGNRYMLCGDAASLIDPWSGEGIETAMESGKFAAEQLLKQWASGDFSAKALAGYDERVYKKMWPKFRNHYYLQKLLSDRIPLINGLVRLANIPWINKRIAKLM